MSWIVVGGIAVGATAGAIVGSKKGGDDVWKDALIGGAIGGVGAGVGAAALPAAEAAAPAVAPEAAGILGGEVLAPAAAESLAFTGPSVGSTVAASAPSGIAAAAPVAGEVAAPAVAASAANPMAVSGTPTFAGSGSSFGTAGSAAVPEGGGLLNAPTGMVVPPAQTSGVGTGTFGTAEPFGATPKAFAGSDSAFGSTGSANVSNGKSVLDEAGNKSMFDKALGWVEENPFKAGILGFTALGLSGALNRNNNQTFGDSSVTQAGYSLSPDFRPSRYAPTRRFADGGIAAIGQQDSMFPQSQYDKTQFATPSQMPISREVVGADYDRLVNPYTGEQPRFARGGSTSAQEFAAMTEAAAAPQETPPLWLRRELVDPMDSGINVDTDVDTKDQAAQTAAQTRMSKLAKKYGISAIAARKQEPENMAGGGIADLGGYAHGGNPRLLRGPGDGMSDDIPATIADKQPARLADGEFVVPADVVSGLGNGSTEAGAKKLHQMMDKVRVDRTGTKKQGKQIDADKYIPGKKAASGGVIGYAAGNLVVGENNQIGTYDDAGNFTPFDLSTISATQAQTTPSSTAKTTAQGYNPDYYNPQFYKSQLPAAEWEVADATKQLASAQSAPAFNAQWYMQQNPDVARNEKYGNNAYQHYLDYGIMEGRAPYEGGQAGMQLQDPAAVAEQQARLDKANAYLGELQSDIGRLENSPVKYDPYTLANRPSSTEPQFYGNIYKPTYENFASPGYDLGAGTGRWNNIASSQFNEPAYLQQKMQQLQETGYKGDFTGATGAQLKDYMAAQGMTPQQHYQLYGRDEGLNPYVNANNAAGTPTLARDIAADQATRFNESAYLQQKMQQLHDNGYSGDFTGTTTSSLKDYMASQGMTPQQHYQLYGKSEGLNPFYATPAPVAAYQPPTKEAPKPEEKKARKGGILAAMK